MLEHARGYSGVEHSNTLTSKGNLATTYHKQGHWDKAEELELQVLGASERILGDEHPDTLTSEANLALTEWKQGRMDDAEELLVQVIQTSERVLGVGHPDTIQRNLWLEDLYEEANDLGDQKRESVAPDDDDSKMRPEKIRNQQAHLNIPIRKSKIAKMFKKIEIRLRSS